MPFTLRVFDYAEESPFDGQWVKEYDPSRPGRDPRGRPMIAHLVTTTNQEEALRFSSASEALAFWQQTIPGMPRERPLTAFTVMVDRG